MQMRTTVAPPEAGIEREPSVPLAGAAVRCEASHSRVRATSSTMHSGPVCAAFVRKCGLVGE
jgi:hypothetical protein